MLLQEASHKAWFWVQTLQKMSQRLELSDKNTKATIVNIANELKENIILLNKQAEDLCHHLAVWRRGGDRIEHHSLTQAGLLHQSFLSL